MNALEFLPFLGHSSIYPPFDKFLTTNGITKRPSLKKNLDNKIYIDNIGLTVSFDLEASLAKVGVIIKSDGTFIFRDFEIIIIPESNKDGKYSGSLPYNILVSDSREQVEGKLGMPRRRNEDSDNYFLDELVWTVAFENGKLQLIQFSLPSDNKRKHGLCP